VSRSPWRAGLLSQATGSARQHQCWRVFAESQGASGAPHSCLRLCFRLHIHNCLTAALPGTDCSVAVIPLTRHVQGQGACPHPEQGDQQQRHHLGDRRRPADGARLQLDDQGHGSARHRAAGGVLFSVLSWSANGMEKLCGCLQGVFFGLPSLLRGRCADSASHQNSDGGCWFGWRKMCC
jgi:hypothetical protein